jgi:hypothetical protein
MRWFYLRTKETRPGHRGRPVACVISELHTEGNGKPVYVTFGVSAHNPVDKFNKQDAVDYALKNMEDKGVSLPFKKGIKKSIIDYIAFAPLGTFPQRARDVARLWLKNQVNFEINLEV